MKKIAQMNQLKPSKVQNFSGDQKVAIKAYFHFLKTLKVPSAKSKPRGPRIGKGKTLTTNHLLKQVGKLRSSTRSNNLCKQMLSKRAQKKRNAAWLRECDVLDARCQQLGVYAAAKLALPPQLETPRQWYI